eukprot:15471433-Alexandrium_andersonii.AAC.1
MKSWSPGPGEVQECAVAAKSGEATMASMGAGERWWPPDAATARSASERRVPHQSPSTARLKSPPRM